MTSLGAVIIGSSLMVFVFFYLCCAFVALSLSIWFDRHWLYKRPMWILAWSVSFSTGFGIGGYYGVG